MLAQKNNQKVWLREQDHPAISLPRWQQQVDLLNDLYGSKSCLILQSNVNEAQIICCSQQSELRFTTGDLIQNQILIKTITDNSGYGVAKLSAAKLGLSNCESDVVLSIQLSWPDGHLFGCILICDPKPSAITPTHAAICESIKALLQGELKQMFMMEQLQRLTVQDEFTYMLNPYGFNLMAPRQLSLSRRFGSHAGLIVLEAVSASFPHSVDSGTSHFVRTIASVISSSMREADICARFNDEQFVILAFVDHESNLDSLIARLTKRLDKEAPEIDLVAGKCFFTPNSQQSLLPMQEMAIVDLEKNRSKLLAKKR